MPRNRELKILMDALAEAVLQNETREMAIAKATMACPDVIDAIVARHHPTPPAPNSEAMGELAYNIVATLYDGEVHAIDAKGRPYTLRNALAARQPLH